MTINEYLAQLTPPQKAYFERVRQIVKQAAPEAEEVISYGIPTFKVNQRPLIYWGAFKTHMSLFPTSDEMMKAIGKAAKFRVSKGTLRFSEADPIPDDVLEQIVRFRLAEISLK